VLSAGARALLASPWTPPSQQAALAAKAGWTKGTAAFERYRISSPAMAGG